MTLNKYNSLHLHVVHDLQFLPGLAALAAAEGVDSVGKVDEDGGVFTVLSG